MQKLYTIFSLVLFLQSSLFANTVATVTALKGSADIQRMSQTLQAKLGSKLENKDTISTQTNSKMQIIFLDETIVSIGKNSNFSIEEYLYEETQEVVAKFGMLQGSMRVITGSIGKIAPHKFNVQTKTATIGIRGTNFTVIVSPDNSLQVYCTYGTISLSYNSEQYIMQQGYFISISPTGKVGLESFDASILKSMKKKHFGLKKDASPRKRNHFSTYAQSEQRLDVKIQSDTITLDDLIDASPDYVHQESYSTTDSSVIASYSMEEAKYRGGYLSDFSNGTLYKSGDAALTINFAKDTAWLGLGSFEDPDEQVRYDFSDVNSNHIKGSQVDGTGTATGDFYTKTGNAITGSFEFTETTNAGANEITASGTYDVSSPQKLH